MPHNITTLLKKLKEHDQHHLWYVDTHVQLLEDMHNCTSLKSLIDFTCNEFDTTLAPL